MSNIELHHMDNMELMARYPDNYFDLAIVDPPYGIKESSFRATSKNCAAKKLKYNTEIWKQNKPTQEYFNELIRVSKNQIIWGGNYFIENLTNTRNYIVWDKGTMESNFADCEMAWTSFNFSAKIFKFRWNGMLQGDMKNKEKRIHPNQKPVAIYQWLLKNYAKPNDKILDTHLGSGSIAIACHRYGFDLVACEIDKEYYDGAVKRLENERKQLNLFIL